MRLRTLLAGVVIMAVAVIGQRLVSLAGDSHRTESLDRQRAAVEVLARSATGLLMMTQDYLLHGSRRAQRQWQSVHRELIDALQDYADAGAEQRAEVAGLMAVAANLPPLFAGLQWTPDGSGKVGNPSRHQTLADQLLTETVRISDGAFDVSRLVTERRRAANLDQRSQTLATQAAMLVLVLVLAWLLLRRVLQPLERLRRGAQAVQDGDLTARIGYSSGDEIGRLSQAFDAMTAALQERAAALEASRERLARSESFQERAGMLLGVGSWELKLDTGSLRWSRQTRDIHEVAPDFEPTLETGLAFYAPEHQATLVAAIERAKAGGGPWDLELPFTTARGRALWVRATGTAEFVDGRPVRLVGGFQDITARRAADGALRAATQAARAASVAKTAFLANMSHEIRTPLNAVIGLSYLMRQTPLDADQDALQRKIGAAAGALLEVVNDVLDLTKIEAGELEFEHAPFDPRLLMGELSGVFAPSAAQRGVALHTTFPSTLPPRLLGDAARLRQLLTNLLSNALKFTAQGEVRLDVSIDDPEARPLQLRFTVQDSGIGMAPDVLARLFTPFTQADTSITRRFGGTGLGLSIVKRLVTLMDGEISVESVLGRGTCFTMILPFEPAEADATDALGLAPLQVLVAEDQDDQRQELVGLCERLGWRTEGVTGGRSLVDTVRARRRDGPALDVLLVDWRMPETDGLQALATLRKDAVSEGSPAVVLVSTGLRKDLAQAPQVALADELLPKPVNVSALFNAVHAAVARRTGDASRVLLTSALDAAGIARLPGVKVLVVDDSDINREVAQRILLQEGAVVLLAADGEEAVTMLRTPGLAVDAVLMDVQMPVMDGLTAARRIRSDLGLARLPIVALTAGAMLSESQRALEAGMDSFVSKPFDPQKLVALLHRLVVRARGAPLTLAPRHVDTAEGAGAAAWPEIDGIDSSDVQRRLMGDLRLFTRLLQQLCEEFAGLAGTTVLPDDAAARAALTARLHKLAGSAGQLGATRLRKAAAAADQALRRGATPDLGAVDAALQALLNASAAWRAQPRPAQAGWLRQQAVGPHGVAPDADALALWKAQLLANDLGALTQFDRLVPALRAVWSPERVEAVESALGRLEFGKVLALTADDSAEPGHDTPPAGNG